jgi:hypothetical protein
MLGMVSASSDEETNVLSIEARGGDPAETAQVASAFAEGFVSGPHRGGEDCSGDGQTLVVYKPPRPHPRAERARRASAARSRRRRAARGDGEGPRGRTALSAKVRLLKPDDATQPEAWRRSPDPRGRWEHHHAGKYSDQPPGGRPPVDGADKEGCGGNWRGP